MIGATAAGRAAFGAVAFAAATTVGVVTPVWALLDGLFPALDLAGYSRWVAAPFGLAATFLVLALPAMAWATVVAALADVDRPPVRRATVRTAVPLALVVLVAVDLLSGTGRRRRDG